MRAKEQPKRLDEVHSFKPNSKELEAFLSVGYGMDKAKAETIIKERQENPALWPYEEYEKAQAFLAALKGKPRAISTKEPWKRSSPS